MDTSVEEQDLWNHRILQALQAIRRLHSLGDAHLRIEERRDEISPE